MKRTLEVLKSYFETGDVPTQTQYQDLFDSLVHKDEALAVIPNTVFINAQNGDDTTAEIGSINNSYKTIDAAITAFETTSPRQGDATDLTHPFLNIVLANGTYEINAQLPQRNIRFESKETCTIDFSNNTNEFLNVLEANTHHKYVFSLPYGTLLNNTENQIYGDYLRFEGQFDVIESYGAPYSNFGKGFICAYQINVNYNLVKGRGAIFSPLNGNSINYFKGNIESIGGHLMINNQGLGVNHFDFDKAYGTHKTSLINASIVATSYVKFGKHYPDVISEIMKISGNSQLHINFKEGAETYGSFNAAKICLTGNPVTINASIARVHSKLIFDNLSVKANTNLCSLLSGSARVYIKNSNFDVLSNIVFIETNTNFTDDCIIFIGHNSIYQTGTPGSDLITKFLTASPTNVSYKVELQNSLITNGVLNTTITGNTNTTATLNIGTTNTY